MKKNKPLIVWCLVYKFSIYVIKIDSHSGYVVRVRDAVENVRQYQKPTLLATIVWCDNNLLLEILVFLRVNKNQISNERAFILSFAKAIEKLCR